MDKPLFPNIPPPATDDFEIMADRHLVEMRAKYGDHKAVVLMSVCIACRTAVVNSTESIEEALDVFKNVTELVELASKVATKKHDPQAN